MTNKFMQMALVEAKKAELIGEVPIGCVIVKSDKVISRAHNQKESKKDGTMHAEIIAIKKACKKLGDWRLDDCELYVTLEPCPMCAGAIVNSRIKKVYFGAYDKVSGCCGSTFNLLNVDSFYHRLTSLGGVMENECSEIIVNFFKRRRKENNLKN